MTQPEPATDAELADYYDRHREGTRWGEPEAVSKPERLDITISVRFTAKEIAALRARAEAAGLKPTTYIRRCALTEDESPIDRGRLSRSVAALERDLEDLRRAAAEPAP